MKTSVETCFYSNRLFSPINMKSLVFFPLLFAFAVNASPVSKTNYLGPINQRSDSTPIRRRFDRPYTHIIEQRIKGTFARHCGVTQLSSEWYLIPAECTNLATTDSLRVVELDFNNNVHGLLVMWSERKIHPDYNEVTKENNIALIKGQRHKQPAPSENLPRLSTGKNDFLNAPAAVYGWTNWPEAESLTMTTIDTKVVRPLWCKLAYPLVFKEEKHLCVFSAGQKGLSQDDIGSPLVIFNSKNVKELVGVATNIRPFTNAISMPMVFAKLEPYKEWIMKETGGALKPN